MKNYIVTLLIALSGIMQGQQSKKITFEYDTAGNQIKRELCINCITKNLQEETPKEISALTEEDLQQFVPGEGLSYYPNPVREELYLQWQQTDDHYIKDIELYNFGGQELRAYSQTHRSNSQTIPFQNYPEGIYLVVLSYSNGDEKTIKIIKK